MLVYSLLLEPKELQTIIIAGAILLLLAILLSACVSLFCVAWGLNTRNIYKHLNRRVETGWASLEEHLVKRYEALPELLEKIAQVKELEECNDLREKLDTARKVHTVEEKIIANKALTLSLRALLEKVGEDTELQSHALVTDAVAQIKAQENEMNVSRQYYNGVVKTYNNKLNAFPARIVGGTMGDGFEKKPFFKFH